MTKKSARKKGKVGKIETANFEVLQEEIVKLRHQIDAYKNRGEHFTSNKLGLHWDIKEPERVIVECETKLPVLTEVEKRALEKGKVSDPVHLIIEGDNYHTLSVLNYTHSGKIDFIYIDPPYNTGARDWRYNNDYVDGEDPYRHSKWLSFMNNRLRLSKNLLKNDGIICVTIDDYEMPRLWMLLESIFGRENHLGTVVVRNNPKGRMTQRKFSLVHEYALFFGKSQNAKIKKLPVAPEDKTHNYIKDKDGTWYLPVNLRKQGVDSNAVNAKGKVSNRYFPIYIDEKTLQVTTKSKLGIEVYPIDSKGVKRIWRRSGDVIDEMYKSGDLFAKKISGVFQLYYKFRGGLDGRLAQTIWHDAKFSASDYGTRILDEILGEREIFQFPKSPHAVKESILAATDNKDAIVLDYFAGSGTTGQVVLELNKEDGGNRKFILATNNENNNDGKGGVAESVCYPRIKKVMEGYGDTDGMPGNLRYFKTEFVEKGKTTDQTRLELVEKASGMIRVREGTYESIVEQKSFKLYRNSKVFTAIVFEPGDIAKQWATIVQKNSEKLPVRLYIFSYNDYAFADEIPETDIPFETCPIPESLLEVYRRVFKKAKK